MGGSVSDILPSNGDEEARAKPNFSLPSRSAARAACAAGLGDWGHTHEESSSGSSFLRRENAEVHIESGAAVGPRRFAALAGLQWEDDVLADERSALRHARPQLARLDQLARRVEGALRFLRAQSKHSVNPTPGLGMGRAVARLLRNGDLVRALVRPVEQAGQEDEADVRHDRYLQSHLEVLVVQVDQAACPEQLTLKPGGAIPSPGSGRPLERVQCCLHEANPLLPVRLEHVSTQCIGRALEAALERRLRRAVHRFDLVNICRKVQALSRGRAGLRVGAAVVGDLGAAAVRALHHERRDNLAKARLARVSSRPAWGLPCPGFILTRLLHHQVAPQP
eukprot:scaffold77110_cov54-Phaeocystis_antarctica.AAC.2